MAEGKEDRRPQPPPSPEDFRPTRRGVLKLIGASAALAAAGGLTGCTRKPRRQVVSRPSAAGEAPPGRASEYASTWTEGAHPYGLMVTAMDGRPIKVDGHPAHPTTQGGSTAAMQASVLSLYDPDRNWHPQARGQAISWPKADEQIVAALGKVPQVVLITRGTLGPSERVLVGKFLSLVRRGVHLVHETADDRPRRRTLGRLFGRDGELAPRFDKARVIVSLDCDFLGGDGVVLESIGQFVAGRELDGPNASEADMSRLYGVGSAMTLTQSRADHRIRMCPSAMGPFAAALAGLVREGLTDAGEIARRFGVAARLVESMADDLRRHRGAALVVAGGHLPADVHAAVALLNDELDAWGQTIDWVPPVTLPPIEPDRIRAALTGGGGVVICLGVNPVYDWPGGGEEFKSLLAGASLSVGHGQHLDETLSACMIALPSSHNLESWNDAAPRAGFESLCQPLVSPLFDTRQEAQSLLAWSRGLAGEGDSIRQVEDFHDFVRQRWTAQLGGVPSPVRGTTRPAVAVPVPASQPVASATAPTSSTQAAATASSPATQALTRYPPTAAELAWQRWLGAGWRQAAAARETATRPALDRELARSLLPGSPSSPALELVILPHHAVYDGRGSFANNAWLQELPDPISRAVWGNYAAISPATARRLGLSEGDLSELVVGDRVVRLPAVIQRGMADEVIAATLGHGRIAGGVVAVEAGGVNLAPLLGRAGGEHLRLVLGVTLRKVEGASPSEVVRTQTERSQHDRPIALAGTLEEYRRDPAFAAHRLHLPPPVEAYPPYDYSKGAKWGLAIDLSACVGCGACATACQAENNIAVVGRQQCQRGRQMHWVRIDRYEDGAVDEPDIHFQPMLCQQCDAAPCETVCPVNATSHSGDGLNEMAYNRCVGTRYCQNNCPYKVRRFNFLRYGQYPPREPAQELAANPRVTVRGVGVMEKCTFCVQRIKQARYEAYQAGTEIPDGRMQTACQRACPAGAIVFGDQNDPASRLARWIRSPRSYRVLTELNTKPNVFYLARVDNPCRSAGILPAASADNKTIQGRDGLETHGQDAHATRGRDARDTREQDVLATRGQGVHATSDRIEPGTRHPA